MSSYYSLPEREYKLLETAIIEEQLVDAVHLKICDFKKTDMFFTTEYVKAVLPDLKTNLPIWSEAPVALDTETSINFELAEDKAYRVQSVIRIPDSYLKVMRTLNQPLDTTMVQQLTRVLTKELEAYVFKGPLLSPTQTRTTTTAITGLCKKAGNTSTYDTVKFAAASGPYETVNHMIGLLEAKGFGAGRLDLITDFTLAKYFRSLPATDTAYSEGSRIKDELLNGGDIYKSDQLIPLTGNDGVLLLVENRPTHYQVKSPAMISLKNQFVWDPRTDEHVGRIEGVFALSVYHPDSICLHSSVDLA